MEWEFRRTTEANLGPLYTTTSDTGNPLGSGWGLV